MFTWLSEKVIGAVISVISGPLLEGYKARLAAMNSTDQRVTELIIADIAADRHRRDAQKEMGILAINHPLWWWAWGLFVIPVGLHHAAVFIVSTIGIPPETFAVLAVPAAERETAKAIVQFIFLSQGVSGIAGALISRFKK